MERWTVTFQRQGSIHIIYVHADGIINAMNKGKFEHTRKYPNASAYEIVAVQKARIILKND